ncbi:phosphoenolpyruvate--protein phosphotransferase [Temperatibacter marinus]|uniref:phosphoenolpyruvate--protein phosphotransferase n=1 Tax=Temperatibacter marinus TaxID=1456591 RepID=A0AA52EFZ8_9PROT|nr:phosphoenolpyruvate--protein phosphotransferase [Temperatibacter marinus]WND01376.1 phosphoenolpyruvate--protein phosphotransferase [Temperatibacter marinus]
MSQFISKPRILLRRLHGIMAGGGSADTRLKMLVKVIAQNMVAEVCSLYLVRAGSVLELFATEGLKEEAVHVTRLNIGQGLVGHVAERGMPLNLSDAPSHPRFAYRPETGEDLFHSFLGVPVIHKGAVRGVLTIQNVATRRYLQEEIEVLQTISMVIAELVSSEALISADELAEDSAELGTNVTMGGMRLVDGVAAGVAVFHNPKVEITSTVAFSAAEEHQKLEKALATLRLQLSDMMDRTESLVAETRDVLEAFSMFAHDRGWHNKLKEAVESGLTAEAAVVRVHQQNQERMKGIRDPYIKERLQDLEDLSNRLIRIIQGVEDDIHETLSEDSILIARTLSATDLLDYDVQYLKGILLEEGSPTSHTTIIARAMDIPVLGRIRNLEDHVQPRDVVVLDSQSSHAYVRPTEDIFESYQQAIITHDRQVAEYASEKDLPVVTKDGQDIALLMNAGLLVDLPTLHKMGAQGIGLYRTEFHFMVKDELPRVTEQTSIYKQVLAEAAGKPVVFRTLDVGGDKEVPFLPKVKEENPAMGWRAIRIALDRPALLRYQLRALLTASAGHPLNVMFPMIAEIVELRRCKSILRKEIDRLEKLGKEGPTVVNVGCMLEVPSLAWQMDLLVQEVDFVSIGSNDLMQFFFACDRGNPQLANRYDLLAPPVLNFLKSVVEKCHSANVPVTLCGEMGGRPIEAMALVALGMRRLSVSPNAVGPVRRMLRTVDLKHLEKYVADLMDTGLHSIRDSLINYAKDHDISLTK